MAAIDSAYQYYLSTYGTSTVSRYDAHKKSQLRDTYNKIVKINKDSPLYKIKNLGEAEKYAIDIKEGTKNIQNVAASLSDDGKGIENVFCKKIAESSDEDVVSAEYIGSDDASQETSFEIEVKHLASGQSNLGNYLKPDKLDFPVGSYSFDLNTNTNSYEFQFTVNKNDNNGSVLQKLSQLINNSKIGIYANIEQNESGAQALRITSKQTGIADDEDFLFQILPSTNGSSIRAMKTLGINHMESSASNAVFLLNGKEYSSYSNTFTVNNDFSVTLNGVSDDGIVSTIGFKTNADAIADNVEKLVASYNGVIKIGHLYSGIQSSNKLVSDISSVAKDYRNELESMGLSLDSENYIQVDRNLLTDAAVAEDATENFTILNEFKDELNERAVSASINPMNYVNKVVVAYKNPLHNFATPYITSIYSGMMLDRYC